MEQGLKAIRACAAAVVDSVRFAESKGQQAPAGAMYAAFMANGMSLEAFEQLMFLLVKVGALKRSGNCYSIGSQSICDLIDPPKEQGQ